MVSTVDSQASAAPALGVLAAPEIDVVTLTVTEKGYCHRPATGALDVDHPDIVHDLANPAAREACPASSSRALERRMQSHGRPVTLVSCDNIPSNGVILASVVEAMADRRGAALAAVDRGERRLPLDHGRPHRAGDRRPPISSWWSGPTAIATRAVVVGEPFRQWVIEDRFAGRAPGLGPRRRHLRRRRRPRSSSSRCASSTPPSRRSPISAFSPATSTPSTTWPTRLLTAFVRRMLVEESAADLAAAPRHLAGAYVEQSFGRLRNTAIRHRNHQIATDGSQKIVQRLLNPIRERLRAGRERRAPVARRRRLDGLSRSPPRRGSAALGRRGPACRRCRGDRRADRPRRGFARRRHPRRSMRSSTAARRGTGVPATSRAMLDGLLSDEPIAYVRSVLRRSPAVPRSGPKASEMDQGGRT